MWLTSSILALTYILTLVNCKSMEIKCPVFCDCDIFENFKRATCSDRSLVSLELNIPPQAEILDLSENHITEIGDKIFLNLGLTNLRLLNVSYNKLRQIHFNGFHGLDHLKTLDLSFNAIEYFTRSWFESLTSLEEFYLRGNKLKSINSEPVIDIGTLRVLDISKCGITKLNPEIFSSLPSLRILDISENYLQYIEVQLITNLPNLTTLRTHDNSFNCRNKKLITATTYIKQKKIDYTDPCIVNENSMPNSFAVNHMVQKFQRIEMEDENDEKPIHVRNSWIFEQEDDKLANKTTIIEICSTNATIENNKKLKNDSILMNIISLSPWTAVSLIFVYGVLCGLTYAITVCFPKKKTVNIMDSDIPDGSIPTRQTLSLRKIRRSNSYGGEVLYSSLKTAKRNLSKEVLDDDDGDNDDLDDTLVMNEFSLASSTPMTSRRVV
ncbi:toll-like receptor 2 isoform X2 [Anthonomus grandis grandis]|uniref:toll-like receptor 2 isoform X2 n=1 Tax=Anthonomus grandis grandis TaxID=2921223 RepID=UPI0021668D3A|nr:toll-like receptor 2 isoform X2 [Anthonomus grandis grandis]